VAKAVDPRHMYTASKTTAAMKRPSGRTINIG
jgi:hypothetical protein